MKTINLADVSPKRRYTADPKYPECSNAIIDRLIELIENGETFTENTYCIIGKCSDCVVSTYPIHDKLSLQFLEEDFKPEYLNWVKDIQSEEYYINMVRAWYFATALAKQYDETVKILENNALDKWTHNKTIQKAIESRRITPEQKDYLRSLKVART